MEIINIKKLVDSFSKEQLSRTVKLVNTIYNGNNEIRNDKRDLVDCLKLLNECYTTYTYYVDFETNDTVPCTLLDILYNFDLLPTPQRFYDEADEKKTSIKQELFDWCMTHECYGGDLLTGDDEEYRYEFK